MESRIETWSVSSSVDMLPFGVTIPATVPQSSEIPEGLMNYVVYGYSLICSPQSLFLFHNNTISYIKQITQPSHLC